MSETDAKKLATSISNLSRYYSLPGISPERMALLMCLGAFAQVYGPKARVMFFHAPSNKAHGSTAAGNGGGASSSPHPQSQPQTTAQVFDLAARSAQAGIGGVNDAIVADTAAWFGAAGKPPLN